MKDVFRIPCDFGVFIKKFRKSKKIKAIDIAKRSGLSRDVLNRLERGEDVTVSSLMSILAAMGLVIRVEKAGLPTLDEMRARFADEEDDAS